MKKTKGRAEPTATPIPAAPGECSGVHALIQRFEQHIDAEDLRMTVADYIRLLQVKRELEADEPRDIEVTWVDPPEEQSYER